MISAVAWKQNLSKLILKAAAAALVFAAFAMVFTSTAKASCVDYTPATSSSVLQSQGPRVIPAAYTVAYRRVSAPARDDRDHYDPTIVGLWKFQFISEGTPGIKDGTQVDFGYAEWHSDGTEVTLSARPPATGNMCLGVYERTGHSTYKLNHFGLAWDPTGTVFVGPANIRQDVTLDDDGDSFTGTFVIDQYDTKGHILAHVTGTVNAQRITQASNW